MVTDNSVINALSYFKLFKWGKNFLNKLDDMCEQACMEVLKEKYDVELIKYQLARMEDSK